MADPDLYDVLIIGGGINGTGIARDAAGRGLSVVLCERDDLASGTSSKSTKLIHGGLRYLEHYEFRLVRESLGEREVLLRAAPHIIWPLRFVLPHHRELRNRWIIRAGLFLYDHLGARERLPGSRGLDLRKHPAGEALRASFKTGFAYSDCRVQDSRLVVLNAMDAQRLGARILTRATVVSAVPRGDVWEVAVRAGEDGAETTVRARAVVNAAGPWVNEVLGERLGVDSGKPTRLVTGSHIVVPRLFPHEDAYLFQHGDGRVVFAIPYEQDFTLIGTTERDCHEDPAQVRITNEEIGYLCAAVSEYFSQPVRPADVVWTYTGVRALFDDAHGNSSAVTRDYVLDLREAGGTPPLLSVLGGKITTSRMLAEHALDALGAALRCAAPAWTAGAALPGGDMENADFDAFASALAGRHPWMPGPLLSRLARNYGTRVAQVIGTADDCSDLGEEVAPGLYEAEIRYLMAAEWARTAEDVLWRRTKLGLHLSGLERERVAQWMASHAMPAGHAKSRAGP